MNTTTKYVLIIGGRGTLGQALVEHFKQKNTWVGSVDHGGNDRADLSIDISKLSTVAEQADWIEEKLKEALKLDTDSSSKFLHGLICVAGGWAGGNVLSENFLNSINLMWRQSVESSAVAAYLGGRLLREGGLMVLTGAQAALNPTPDMIGYGMAKAAVHHLIKCLACEGGGLPRNCVVVGILPRTLDTPNNRKFATGKVDYGTWTPLNHIAGFVDKWLNSEGGCSISSGSLVEVITVGGKTTTEIH